MITRYFTQLIKTEYPDEASNVQLNQFNLQAQSDGTKAVLPTLVMVTSEGGVSQGFGKVNNVIFQEVVSVFVKSSKQTDAMNKINDVFVLLINEAIGGNDDVCVSSIHVLNSPYLYSKSDNNEYIFNLRLNVMYKNRNI